MRRLDGKTIKNVDMRPFDGSIGPGGPIRCTNPKITFSDGSSLTFCVQEAEHGEHGVGFVYAGKPKPARAPKPDRKECRRCGGAVVFRRAGTEFCTARCEREQAREDRISADMEREHTAAQESTS